MSYLPVLKIITLGFVLFFHVDHVRLQIAYAENVSQIENLIKAINTHLTPLFCVIYTVI